MELKHEPCECENWCSHDVGMLFLTGHHESCSKRTHKLETESLRKLVFCLNDLVSRDPMMPKEQASVLVMAGVVGLNPTLVKENVL